MATVIVAGLGPADAGLIPARTHELVATHPTWLRTRRHPAAEAFPETPSFDHLYEVADSLDDVYAGVVEQLADAAEREGTAVYLVPGSPLVAERTVELLRAHEAVDVDIVPAVSFLDLAWARLGVDPLALGVSIVDGHRFEVESAGRRGPLLVGQCDDRFVLSDIKLSVDDLGSGSTSELPAVTVLQRLGLPDEHCVEVAWEDLDRSFEPDHLTSIWIPWLPRRPSEALAALHGVVARLRAECPWDRDQTHASLAKYALEEAEEVAEAVAALDELAPSQHEIDDVVGELGDLLFQVMLHAAIGEESGDFSFVEVAEAITTKMIRRHPHVFDRAEGDQPLSMAELAERWEDIKAEERAARDK
ncbi:MAG: MazG nucleotide pyrophosphohydrolase domain-containing protein [Actinomycetota bacterium]|nr:MazG nucleotide pyrophosphohydrolase domain-containing protein [Actinomycetota bacterium]